MCFLAVTLYQIRVGKSIKTLEGSSVFTISVVFFKLS